MPGFMQDKDVIERILTHVSEGTTDLGQEVWREPVENYCSEARFEQELALLQRLPVPFCPSAALSEAGAYVARQAAGVPIVAVRGKDGVVRAFRNACRHRGAEVLAVVEGYGASADGFHLSAPDEEGRGAVRAMRAALSRAGLEPASIDAVNAHATATPAGDPVEAHALRTVFGASPPPVSATKSTTRVMGSDIILDS